MLLRSLALSLVLMFPPAAVAGTILVFGDSLSAGYGIPLEQSWVSRLERRLHDENFDYKIANASISGETTAGGRNRIAEALAAHRPAIVILALGANDGLRGHSPEAMRANLEAMIEAARRSHSTILLVGMRLPPNYGPVYTEKFQRVFADLARERKLPLVPFLLDGFAEKPAYFQADGLHPTAEAQSLIAETVWKALQPLLTRGEPAAARRR